MKTLPDPLTFEWDQGNKEKNFIKHGVTKEETEEAIIDKKSFLFPDERHSGTETRYGLYGQSNEGRRLSIVFTVRKRKVRVIMARDMSKKERRSYEKIKANTSI